MQSSDVMTHKLKWSDNILGGARPANKCRPRWNNIDLVQGVPCVLDGKTERKMKCNVQQQMQNNGNTAIILGILLKPLINGCKGRT